MLRYDSFGHGAGSASNPPAQVDFLASYTATDTSRPRLFAGVSFGAEAGNRRIFVAIGAGSSTIGSTVNCQISAVTIGGIAATKHVGLPAGNVNHVSEIWSALVPTGTTGDVSITYINGTTGWNRWSLGVFRAVDLVSATPTDTDSSTGTGALSATLDVAAGGFVIAHYRGDGAPTVTFTNGTEAYDVAVGSERGAACADEHASSAPGLTITCTPDGGATPSGWLVAASFR